MQNAIRHLENPKGCLPSFKITSKINAHELISNNITCSSFKKRNAGVVLLLIRAPPFLKAFAIFADEKHEHLQNTLSVSFNYFIYIPKIFLTQIFFNVTSGKHSDQEKGEKNKAERRLSVETLRSSPMGVEKGVTINVRYKLLGYVQPQRRLF